ncbi:MAG: ATP-binding protein [Planctomycetota bacterium]|jgi:predicted ATPase|nr:ATP-binding protein [Planctomycetota bacterium]
MLEKLHLKDFRIFNDKTVTLGRAITAIAGHNATGKSTLLGIIGNACELKGKAGKTVTGGLFRTEFSDIFKGSRQHDGTGQIGSLSVREGGEDRDIQLRVAWQKYKTKLGSFDRFRIIPKWSDGSSLTEGKYPLPSMYLGLSRLYPLGEVPNHEVKQRYRLAALKPANLEWIYEKYNHILTLSDKIDSISNYRVNKKISGGVNTRKYDFLTNSSGQDNLMQILYALMSFKNLRAKMGPQWRGGVFLVDEIDAALHPAAQVRLIEALFEFCGETGVQVVFTTHSLQILAALAQKSEKGEKRHGGDVVINYLSTANKILEAFVNPSFEMIRNDMMIENSLRGRSKKKVNVYSEDRETRWFIKKMLPGCDRFMKVVDIAFGCDQAKSWLKSDPEYFNNILFVLDGDVSLTDADGSVKNIIKLPGGISPEKTLYDYLEKMPADHEYLRRHRAYGTTIRYILENGPSSGKYKAMKKERERCKQWFKDNLGMLEESGVYEYWARDHANELKDFRDAFKRAHAIVAGRTEAVKIPSTTWS